MAVDLSSTSSSSQQLENFATGSGDAADSTDLYLFNRTLLSQLSKWAQIEEQLMKLNLIARPLKQSDYHQGYLELLAQLTEVGDISENEFDQRFNEMKQINSLNSGDQYLIVVIEDKESSKIVACSTLFIELKFIHKCARRGRLEEVAVLDSYRGKGIGKIIVEIIVQLACEIHHCYKLSLDCNESLRHFYSLNNFSYSSDMLCIRF